MNIKNTIITAAVGLTMVGAMIVPMAASAITTSMTGSIPTACVGVTFTRNLVVGSTGQDVQCLQAEFNTHGLVLAASGAGSPGMETWYFGPRTLASVRAWQASNGWTPANQVGPLSRAMLNSWLSGTTNTGGLPVGCTSTAGFSPVTGQSCATGVITNPTGPVSAMLATDNPAAGSIVGGQASADLMHVTFTGSGTVTSVTLQRSGISDQNTLTNVYLYDGNVRITDGYAFNVNGQIVINGLSISVAGSHTISVRGDVATTAPNTASTLAVSLTGFTANATPTSASVMGNSMFIVVGNLATAWLGANTVYNANAVASVNAGTTQYTVWSAPLQINTRTVWLKMANFRMVGSAPADALNNIKLFIDGVDTGKVGTVMTINGSNYAVFDLTSSPISLMTGSHTVDVRGDIQKGTNRTVQFSVQNASDLTVYDPQVGVNIATLGASGAAFSINTGANVSILTGSVTVVVDPAFTTQNNVTGGSPNVVIGRFKIHPYGEDIKVNTLSVTPSILGATSTGATCTTDGTTGVASGTCGLNNVTLYFNGSQVGSQVTYSSGTYTMGTTSSGTAITFSLGSQLIAPAGVDSYLEVRVDLQTTANVAYTGGTVKVGLGVGASNGQGMSSQAAVNVPTAAVATTGLTIQTGGLQVSKNTAYLNQNISPNVDVKIGSYVIQNQSSSQSIRLTQLSIATTIATTTVSNFSQLRTSDTTGSGSTPVQFSGTQSGTTSTDVFSVNDTLAPGASMTLDVWAHSGAATSGTIATTLTVSSIGVTDNLAATSSTITGQTLTLGTGTLGTPTLKPTVSDTVPAQFILGGSTKSPQATFNFISTSGASTITELGFTVSGSDATPTSTITNVCVGSACQQPITMTVGAVSTGVSKLTGLNLAVPNGGNGLDVPVTVSYSTVGTGGIVSNKTSIVALGYAKYNTGSAPTTIGNSDVCTALIGAACATSISTVNANTMTMIGSLPVVTLAAGNSQNLNADTLVSKVTIANASGGQGTRIRTIVFNLAYSGFNTLPTSIAAESLTDAAGNTISTFTCTDGGVSSGAATVTCTNTTATYATDYPIGGTPQEFDLHVTTAGAANTTGTPRVATTLGKSTFKWDDTSWNGTAAGAGDVNIAGTLIYNFPTTSVSN